MPLDHRASPFTLHHPDWPLDPQATCAPPQWGWGRELINPYSAPPTCCATLVPPHLCSGPPHCSEKESPFLCHMAPQRWSWTQNPLASDSKAHAPKHLTQWALAARTLEQAAASAPSRLTGSGLQPRGLPGMQERTSESPVRVSYCSLKHQLSCLLCEAFVSSVAYL